VSVRGNTQQLLGFAAVAVATLGACSESARDTGSAETRAVLSAYPMVSPSAVVGSAYSNPLVFQGVVTEVAGAMVFAMPDAQSFAFTPVSIRIARVMKGDLIDGRRDLGPGVGWHRRRSPVRG
jgi:hypothetical protein